MACQLLTFLPEARKQNMAVARRELVNAVASLKLWIQSVAHRQRSMEQRRPTAAMAPFFVEAGFTLPPAADYLLRRSVREQVNRE